MIDYDSFSRCHLTDIFFFTFHAGAKELSGGFYHVFGIKSFKHVNKHVFNSTRNNQVRKHETESNIFTSPSIVL